jgi:hypothetical protein
VSVEKPDKLSGVQTCAEAIDDMNQRLLFSSTTLTVTLLLSMTVQATPTTDTASTFRIMSEQEMASHEMTMQVLQGQAREDYRNAQYAKLRQRAFENGYSMPATPPWAQAADAASGAEEKVETQAVSAAAMVDSPAAAGDGAAARHAAMREKLEARLTDPRPTVESVPATSSPTETKAAVADSASPMTEAESPASENINQQAQAAVESTTLTRTPIAETPVVKSETASASATPATPATPAANEAGAAQRAQPSTPAPAPPPAMVAAPAPDSTPSPVSEYRDQMRDRFESYMQERQAQREAELQRQREQHESSIERNRAQMARPTQPPYPSAQGYGPRYPAAFPGYRVPYWQQPQPPQPPQQPRPPQAPAPVR